MGLLLSRQPQKYVSPIIHEPYSIEAWISLVNGCTRGIAIVSNGSLVTFNERFTQHLIGDKTKQFLWINEKHFPNQFVEYIYVDLEKVKFTCAKMKVPGYFTYVNGEVQTYEQLM